MKDIRTNIIENRFPDFIKDFMQTHFQGKLVPKWILDALASVNVIL